MRLIPTLLTNVALSTVLLKHKEVFGSFLDLTLKKGGHVPYWHEESNKITPFFAKVRNDIGLFNVQVMESITMDI